MEIFIASLMKRIPNKHTSLSSKSELGMVWTMAMNVGIAPEHPKVNLKNETGRRIRLLETLCRDLEVENTREHSINKMSCNENNITLHIGEKGSRQHKGASYFHKVTAFSLSNPILFAGVPQKF